MRVAMAITWNLHASSLTNIARNNFRELGKLMNQTKSFTITAIEIESVGIGDFNQYFDLLHIPNMGGYRFPVNAALHCNNIILGVSGIDEIIYGKDILAWKGSWSAVGKEISKEIRYWKKYIDNIKNIHVPANSELEEFHKYLQIPYEKMSVIHHGVNHSFFKPSKDSIDTRKKILSKLNIPNYPYFLHIGEYNYVRKNQQRLAQAFAQAKKSGLKHNLIIAGKHYSKIENKLSTIDGIFFLDWIPDDDLLQLIQGSDAFFLPSIHEGFGMPLVESMACGIPCVSSNCHAPPEIILDSGILVDPYNVDAISDSMLKLDSDEKLVNSLSAKSLSRAQDFSWEKNAQEIFKLYKIDTSKPMENFEKQYDLAAYRTLVSVCVKFPDSKQNLFNSILRFDYSDLLHWAINFGLKNFETMDFLLPFADWYYTKFKELSKNN